MNQVLELVSFKLKPNASATQFTDANKTVETWLRQQGGFVSRHLCENDNGTWHDVVVWQNGELAQDAAESFMQELCDSEFMAMIDSTDVVMTHSRVAATLRP
jgi:hypothetical protein